MNESPQDPQASRVPMRGIAMILLAVAIALLAWGVYAMTNSDDKASPVVQKPAPTSEVKNPAQNGQHSSQPASPQPSPVQSPVQSPAPSAVPASVPAQAPAGVNGGQASQSGVDPSAVKVHALNNSTVQGLANKVADRLKREGYTQVDSGNFPEEVLPHSVAFYTPGNAGEEQAAQQIARTLNIKAEPRIPALKETPAGVVVVITEDLNS